MKRTILLTLSFILIWSLSGCQLAMGPNGEIRPMAMAGEKINPGRTARQNLLKEFNRELRGYEAKTRFTSTMGETIWYPRPEDYIYYDNWLMWDVTIETAPGETVVVRMPLPKNPVSLRDFMEHVNGSICYVDRYGDVGNPNCWGWFPGNTRDITALLWQYNKVQRKTASIHKNLEKGKPNRPMTEGPPRSRLIDLGDPNTRFMFVTWHKFASKGFRYEKSAETAYYYYVSHLPDYKELYPKPIAVN
ncbi:hypothetical protein ACFL0Z_03240 [Patescibacteria group bacterium]